MTTPIVLFLLFGTGFGALTFSRRHLFSEGPTRPRPGDAPPSLGERVMWILLCSALWPLMVLTGVYSLWRLRRVPVDKPRR